MRQTKKGGVDSYPITDYPNDTTESSPSIEEDTIADLKFIKDTLINIKNNMKEGLQKLHFTGLNVLRFNAFVKNMSENYFSYKNGDNEETVKKNKELAKTLEPYANNEKYSTMDIRDIINFNGVNIPILHNTSWGGSSKITFYKKVDGKTKKYTRVVQLNKRGTKCVKCDGKLVPISKLKKTP